MKKFPRTVSLILAISASVSLSGCAVLYPNWGTDQNPSTSASPTEVPSTTPSETSTESPSASPSASEESKKIVAQINLIETVIDASSGTMLVVSEILNAVENGGKCAITFKGGSVTKSVSVRAEANASTTQCFPAYIPLSGLPKGKGTLTITYESEKYFGTSQAFEVTVP